MNGLEDDTICHICTGVGGSISIIRISGGKAASIMGALFVSVNGKKQVFESHKLYYGHVVFDGDVIDECMAVLMYAPKSYTAEDVCEFQCHGGARSQERIIRAVCAMGARLALPGEFTKRAFLNGRIDLSEAEAVMDIIGAQTDISHKLAVNRLGGGLRRDIERIRDLILACLSKIEADIDYPEYEETDITIEEIDNNVKTALHHIRTLIKSYESGKIIKNGINAVLIGKPNVGKSSVLNSLLDEERAIVTPVPGTTRDHITETISVCGIPVNLTDTAGVRETGDEIERYGIERTLKLIEGADLLMFVFDGSEPLTDDDLTLLKLSGSKNSLALINKNDLPVGIDLDVIKTYIEHDRIIDISALNNYGIDDIKKCIERIFSISEINIEEGLVTNSRNYESLSNCEKALVRCTGTLSTGLYGEFLSIDLKDAYNALLEITGEIYDEDVINRIFADFCLGK